MIRRSCVMLILTAALGACHEGQKAGHGEVSGQILPGSVSDAMLPYDTVKSKAPLAPKEADSSDDTGGNDNALDSAAAAANSESAAPDMAASPSPVATAVPLAPAAPAAPAAGN